LPDRGQLLPLLKNAGENSFFDLLCGKNGKMGSGLEISFFNQPLLEHLTDRCVMNILSV